MEWIERKLAIADDPLPDKVDAIICVGIDVSGDGLRASPYSRAVALKAIELDDQFNHQAKIICTGGYCFTKSLGEAAPTEALTMARILIEEGIISSRRIILEKQAVRTYQNADNTLPIVKKLQAGNVVIVAQQLHARRVKRTFQKRWEWTGIQIFIVKAPSRYGGGSQKRLDHPFSFFLWDSLAFVISWLKGYTLLPFAKPK